MPIGETEPQPVPLLDSRFNEFAAVFSPDGGSIAYVSDEEGQPEVFVQEILPEGDAVGLGLKRKVSSSGGFEPMWSRDGGELFYRSGDRERLLSASIRREPQLEVGDEEVVLDGLHMPAPGFVGGGPFYDVSPDGSRFLMVVEAETPETMRLVVVLDWDAELKRLVPTDNSSP